MKARGGSIVVLFALALACLVLADAVALEFAVGLAPRRAEESALESLGHSVSRTMSPAWSMLDASRRPDVLIVSDATTVVTEMRDELLAFVDGGGELWILSVDPSLAGVLDTMPRVLAGFVHDESGGRPRLDAASGERAGELAGTRALDLDGTAFAPRILTSRESFRDTNANGRLDAGEAAGPFVVGAERVRGNGRIVILAVQDMADVSSATFGALTREGRGALSVMFASQARDAWFSPGRALVTFVALPATSGVGLGVLAVAALSSAVIVLTTTRRESRSLSTALTIIAAAQESLRHREGEDAREMKAALDSGEVG